MADERKFSESGALLPCNYKKASSMPNSSVTIPLDPQTARCVRLCNARGQAQNTGFTEPVASGSRDWSVPVSPASARRGRPQAKARGLTPEIGFASEGRLVALRFRYNVLVSALIVTPQELLRSENS